MIACLPMYDWLEQRQETDALWALIRDRLRDAGIAAPDRLTRDGDLNSQWSDPGLVLGQTCGMPYRTRLHDRCALVGTPDFALPGVPPGYYYSVLVTAADARGELGDYAGKLLACNSFDSQSGWAAPQNQAAAAGFAFKRFVLAGAHLASATAVAEGRADIAALDVVTWRLIARHRPEVAARLRVLGHTAPTPALPLITAQGRDAAVVFGAVAAAIAALEEKTRATLGITRLVAVPKSAYMTVPTPPPPSADQFDPLP